MPTPTVNITKLLAAVPVPISESVSLQETIAHSILLFESVTLSEDVVTLQTVEPSESVSVSEEVTTEVLLTPRVWQIIAEAYRGVTIEESVSLSEQLVMELTISESVTLEEGVVISVGVATWLSISDPTVIIEEVALDVFRIQHWGAFIEEDLWVGPTWTENVEIGYTYFQSLPESVALGEAFLYTISRATHRAVSESVTLDEFLSTDVPPHIREKAFLTEGVDTEQGNVLTIEESVSTEIQYGTKTQILSESVSLSETVLVCLAQISEAVTITEHVTALRMSVQESVTLSEQVGTSPTDVLEPVALGESLDIFHQIEISETFPVPNESLETFTQSTISESLSVGETFNKIVEVSIPLPWYWWWWVQFGSYQTRRWYYAYYDGEGNYHPAHWGYVWEGGTYGVDYEIRIYNLGWQYYRSKYYERCLSCIDTCQQANPDWTYQQCWDFCYWCGQIDFYDDKWSGGEALVITEEWDKLWREPSDEIRITEGITGSVPTPYMYDYVGLSESVTLGTLTVEVSEILMVSEEVALSTDLPQRAFIFQEVLIWEPYGVETEVLEAPIPQRPMAGAQISEEPVKTGVLPIPSGLAVEEAEPGRVQPTRARVKVTRPVRGRVIVVEIEDKTGFYEVQ